MFHWGWGNSPKSMHSFEATHTQITNQLFLERSIPREVMCKEGPPKLQESTVTLYKWLYFSLSLIGSNSFEADAT